VESVAPAGIDANDAPRPEERAAGAFRFVENVAHVGSAVARELAPAEILETVLDQTIRTLGASCAAVYVADEEQRVLTLRGFRNLPEDLRELLSQVSFDAPALSARAAATRHLQVISSNAELDSGLSLTKALLARTGCETLCAVPLLARSRLVGVLTFALVARHEFTAAESAAIEDCAEIFSFGIAHADLYDEERRLRGLFEAVGHAAVAITSEVELGPFLQNVINEARRVADAEFAALGIPGCREKAAERWVFSGMAKKQVNRMGRIRCSPSGVLDAHIVRLGNLPPTTSLLQVPIHHNGSCPGVLFLMNKRGGVEFNHEDELAVELLAEHIGAAVHQTHLIEKLDVERQRLKAIVENVPHGVVFVETLTGKVSANGRAIELVGRPFPGEASKLWERFLTPLGGVLPEENWLASLAAGGDALTSQELVIRRPDGMATPVLVSASRFRDARGVLGVVVLFEDITVLKDVQQLSGRLGHDRNP
jgi:PAS domain S-box-containing protein